MKILFDNGTPNPIAPSLVGHEVTFARKIGWHTLKNGELIQRAEEAGYELLLTTDKSLRYQQNLAARRIAVIVLGNPQWPDVKLCLARIADRQFGHSRLLSGNRNSAGSDSRATSVSHLTY